MSRQKKNRYGLRSITIHLNEEDSIALDQFSFDLNLDSRSEAVVCLMRAGRAALPVDTAIFEICQASIANLRRTEADALADFHASRAALYRQR